MKVVLRGQKHQAAIAQLGERQTEDLKVPGSIPGLGTIGKRPLWKRQIDCQCYGKKLRAERFELPTF